MIHGIKLDYNGFFYRKQKHYCAVCGDLLVPIKQEKIVNSESEEAKYYDFQNFDNYLVGNIKFVKFAFKCPSCEKVFSINEQRNYEKKSK